MEEDRVGTDSKAGALGVHPGGRNKLRFCAGVNGHRTIADGQLGSAPRRDQGPWYQGGWTGDRTR